MTSATMPPSLIDARGLQVRERRVAEVRPEGAGAAVGDDVGAELAAGRLDRHVRLAGRDPEALGHQLEVVDQGLHRLTHDVADVVEAVAHAVAADRELAGPGDLLVGDHDRGALEPGQPVGGLLDDLQRLPHLGEADPEATVGVAGVPGLDLEVVVLVAAVGLGLAQVPRVAGAAEHRTGEAERQAAGEVEVADVLQAGLEDRVGVAQRGVLGRRFFISGDEVADLVQRAGRQVLGDAAGADERVVHPQAGDQLEEVEHQLALAEADRHHRQRADLHATGGDADQVGGDAVELHEQDPHDLGLLRDVVLDVEQPLDAEQVGHLVVERAEVVHPGAERDALRPGAELHVLLDAGVEVADAATGLGHRLALELEDQAEHAVRRRVLRAHVDDDALVGVTGVGEALGDGVPVLAGDGEDATLGGLAAAGVEISVVLIGVPSSLCDGGAKRRRSRKSWGGSSVVRPPLIGRRDGSALVLHGDAAQG